MNLPPSATLHPDRQVVVYANTSAAVKARADWMVTSSCALAIVAHLKAQGHKILWAPDRHLGRYIQEQTGADMLMWNGACIVHDEFKGLELELLRREHPQAQVLVHPESPAAWWQQADVVGSTSQLLQAVVQGTAPAYIVATDNGMMHRMRQLAPGKLLIEAPTAGNSATCKSCAHCPWMAMNALQGVVDCLEQGSGEVRVPEPVRSAGPGLHRAHAGFRQGPPGQPGPATVRLREGCRAGLNPSFSRGGPPADIGPSPASGRSLDHDPRFHLRAQPQRAGRLRSRGAPAPSSTRACAQPGPAGRRGLRGPEPPAAALHPPPGGLCLLPQRARAGDDSERQILEAVEYAFGFVQARTAMRARADPSPVPGGHVRRACSGLLALGRPRQHGREADRQRCGKSRL
jgi:hypothetical protein